VFRPDVSGLSAARVGRRRAPSAANRRPTPLGRPTAREARGRDKQRSPVPGVFRPTLAGWVRPACGAAARPARRIADARWAAARPRVRRAVATNNEARCRACFDPTLAGW